LAFTVTMLDQYAEATAQGLQAMATVEAEHEDRVNVTLDAATEGTLSTRTNDTSATTITFSGGNGDNLPIATTEVTVFEPIEVTQVVTKTKQQAMLMSADGRIVVRTNSVTVPANTWEFEENDGFSWRESGVFANPFSADVTAFWLSNGRAEETTFNFRNLRTE
jgi:hypothetical protein